MVHLQTVPATSAILTVSFHPPLSPLCDSILRFRAKTGIQTLVVAVTVYRGEVIVLILPTGWIQETGVGQKERDGNGLVILLSTDERCVQSCYGYGLEGILPMPSANGSRTGLCCPISRIQLNAGMVAGIRAVKRLPDGSMENIGNDERR